MHSNIFDRISFLSLFLVVVLLPLFALPFTSIPLETSKGLLLVVGLCASLVFWAIARFSDGKIIFPRSWLLISGFGVALSFLLSALFSGSKTVSMFGTMFDPGTFWFILSGFVLMLMSSVVFAAPGRAQTALRGLAISSAVLLVFQAFHTFMPGALSLGILSGKTGNLLGTWNTLGLFAGLAGMMSLFVLEFFPVSKREKITLWVLFALSLLTAVAVNFLLVWAMVGISSLLIFVYKTSRREWSEGNKKSFPVAPLLVTIFSLLFLVSPNFLGSLLPVRLGTITPDVSPSWSTTLSVTRGVLSEDPVFGTGPNRFGEAWAMYRPSSINDTPFWDTPFESGSGLLPTFISTTGAVGILSWLIFIALFLFAGWKLMGGTKAGSADREASLFFLLALYLFVASWFYFTGTTLFLLALAFTGIFIGLSAGSREVSFLSDPRKSFFSILALVALVVISAGVSFKYLERFASVPYFVKAAKASTVADAESMIGKALSLYQNDLYWRTYSQINLLKVESLAKKSDLTETDKSDLQKSMDNALSGAQNAVIYNPASYINFTTLGSVYQVAAQLGMKEGTGRALEAYQSAEKLNSSNPAIKIGMARTVFAEGKTAEAKNYVSEALKLKADYVEALVVLSQIAKSEGDDKSALAFAEAALSISPEDKELKQYVDSLKGSSSGSEGSN